MSRISHLRYLLHSFHVGSKYMSATERMQKIDNIYSYLNDHFMEIYFLKTKLEHRQFFFVSIVKAEQILLELQSSDAIDSTVSTRLEKTLHTFLHKRDFEKKTRSGLSY